MLKKIVSITYLVSVATSVINLPLSAIFLIFKLCGSSGMSWIDCCIPIIIVLCILPLLLISKFLLDTKGV